MASRRTNAVGQSQGSGMEAAPAPQGAALTRSGGPVEELKSLIVKVYLTSKASLLILGPPGVGKSSAVMQAGEILAELMGRKLVIYDDDTFNSMYRIRY